MNVKVRTGLCLGAGIAALLTAAPNLSAQQAGQPLFLGVPRAAETVPVPPKPVGAPAARSAQTAPAAPAVRSVQTAPAAAGSQPVPSTVGAIRKPAKPAGTAAAPKPAVTTAQKVPASARLAATIAALTAQATPPVHDHVFKPYAGTCDNPGALGVSRVMEVDTTGGYYLGQTYRTQLPLAEKEIVLTFDDGPTPRNTQRVLDALEKECLKATFFIVGDMAKAYPEQLRKTAAAGHTIAYHTMTHPLDLVKRPLEWGQNNIRTGWQTVDQIVYGHSGDRPQVPFFRYPGLFNSRSVNEWLNGMDMGVFAADAVGNDWIRSYDSKGVMNFALKDIERAGNRGILLLHDTKDTTATMLPDLLRELKARGYKIVHMVPKKGIPPLADGTIINVAGTTTGSVDVTPPPLPDRQIAGFTAGRQIDQAAQGRDGSKPAAAPLPTYDSAALIKASAKPAAPAAPPPAEVGWFSSTASTFKGIGSAIGLW
jgi:peptidoglycan/xylan/chitin deacetylase (PgdA/CDA1 family)